MKILSKPVTYVFLVASLGIIIYLLFINNQSGDNIPRLTKTITGGNNLTIETPVSVCQDEATGKVFIADAKKSSIAIFNQKGEYIKSFGLPGFGNGHFEYPYGMIVTSYGTLWVSDPPNRTIQEYTLDGAFKRRVFYGSDGTQPGMMVRRGQQVFVSDIARNQIVVLDSNGKEINPRFNQLPLTHPQGLAFDSKGQLWIADEGSGTLKVLLPDGKLSAQIPVAAGQKDLVRGLAIDNKDRVWVSFTLSGKILAIDNTGATLFKLDSKNVMPSALWCNKRNQLFVVDEARHVIDVWSGVR